MIGRNVGDSHHVLEQHTGPHNAPHVQKLHLGWVIAEEVCLGKTHRPDVVEANKVVIMSDGKNISSTPCLNNIIVKENLPKQMQCDAIFKHPQRNVPIGQNIFYTSYDDARTVCGKWIISRHYG